MLYQRHWVQHLNTFRYQAAAEIFEARTHLYTDGKISFPVAADFGAVTAGAPDRHMRAVYASADTGKFPDLVEFFHNATHLQRVGKFH